jgi:putative oxidoreductase
MGKGWSDWASLPLRLVLGFGFVYHGFPKLFSGQAHDGFVGMLQGIGIPASGLMAWVVGIVEFFGGLLLIAGAFVTIVSILGIVNMLVAMFTVHLPNGFNFINIVGMAEGGKPMFGMPGYEVNLLYIAGFVALILAGAGALSVDQRLAEKRGSPGGPTF